MIKLDIVFPSAYLSLQGGQDTNHGSLLKNTAYTGQCMTEANVHDIHFQVAQICTTQPVVKYYLHWNSARLRYQKLGCKERAVFYCDLEKAYHTSADYVIKSFDQ